MDQEQQDGQQQQPRWQPTREQLLWAGGITTLTFLLIVIFGYLFGWKWTGLPKQTLWDWLDLLIVPAVLAVGGYLFTRSENERTQRNAKEQRELDRQIADQRTKEDRKIAHERAETDRQIADQRRQDEVLQAYLDYMGGILLDKEKPLRQSEESDEVRTLARARTLTVLRRLDSERKGTILRFLYESYLITKDRRFLNLSWANLTMADLSVANLKEANLSGADLSDANLRNAFLDGAKLGGGLSGNKILTPPANLSGADLRSADLSGADLSDTSNLLADQAVITYEELEQQADSLKGATMPNGQKYEDWLKDREKRQQNE